MATPTEKAPAIENFLFQFGDRKQAIRNNVCVFCEKPAVEFKDGLSRNEYCISGLCQNCQDQAFEEQEDEDEDDT